MVGTPHLIYIIKFILLKKYYCHFGRYDIIFVSHNAKQKNEMFNVI